MQVILDPNEYDHLQGKLFASFSNVKPDHLTIAAILIAIICLFLWHLAPQLDVLHLGNDHAINLGIDLRRLQLMTLFAITALVGISTALVGPTSFLLHRRQYCLPAHENLSSSITISCWQSDSHPFADFR
jgi:iron complex transport system permease protein